MQGDVEAVKAQIRAELEEKMKQHLSDAALKAAQEEAEAQVRGVGFSLGFRVLECESIIGRHCRRGFAAHKAA